MERRHIARALEAEKGNVDRTAKVLGISRSSLYQKIKAFGLSKGGGASA
jgi:transcriptional regulator of acetoin/glycerol metabolism